MLQRLENLEKKNQIHLRNSFSIKPNLKLTTKKEFSKNDKNEMTQDFVGKKKVKV